MKNPTKLTINNLRKMIAKTRKIERKNWKWKTIYKNSNFIMEEMITTKEKKNEQKHRDKI